MIVSQLSINPEYIKMRWQEPYVSGGLNRKMFGVIPAGIYHGLSIVPGSSGRKVIVNTDDPYNEAGSVSGYSGGNYDSAGGYSVAVVNDRRGMQTTITIDQGVSGSYELDLAGHDSETLYIVMKARFYIGQWTDAWFAAVTAEEIDGSPEYIVVGTVNVPTAGTDIDLSHITYRTGSYPRTEPYATWDKWGWMKPEYVRKVDTIEKLMYRKLTGGGMIAFDGSNLTWDDQIRIYIPGYTDSFYANAGSTVLSNNGEVLYAALPHGTPSGALSLYKTTIENVVVESVSGICVPIFIRAFNRIYSGDGGTLQLSSGESVSGGIDTDIPAPVLALLGISETATSWGFTNNFPGSSSQNLPARLSSLSSDDQDLHEDRNILLSCSGNVAWDSSTGGLQWSEPFEFSIPDKSFNWYVAASSISGMVDGDVVYVTGNRSAQSWMTAVKVSKGSLPLDMNNKNLFVLAYRVGDLIIFRNGYVLRSGYTSPFSLLLDRDENLRWDAAMNRVVFTGQIDHSDVTPGMITWGGDIVVRSMAGNLYYELPSGSITLADQDVGYLDINRGIDLVPHLLWTNGSAIVTSVAAASWTSSLTSGDWIKKKALGFSKYYRISTVDSVSQVTLDTVAVVTTSSVSGDKSQYAKYQPSIVVANRSLVPEYSYWMFHRDDRAASKARVYIRDVGEVGQGEKITATNWVYDEAFVTDTVSGVGSVIPLPLDSRDGDRQKYYRVGSGDLVFEVNGVEYGCNKVPVTSQMGLLSYSIGTGLCTVLGGTDISNLRQGDWYKDALLNEWRVTNVATSTQFFVAAGSTLDPGFGGYGYRQSFEEIGSLNDLSYQIRLKTIIQKNALLKFRIHPINRPYSDGAGSGVSGGTGGGGGGAGTLQEAYDGGFIVHVVEGKPVTIVGTGLVGKTMRILGDLEVSGVLDPTAVTYTEMASDPIPLKSGTWMDLAGNFWFEDRVRGVTHMLTEQGKWKKGYQNNTGVVISKGRVVTKDGSGKIKYASNASELLSNTIGVVLANIAHSATGYVQREGWVESSIFDTGCFVEASLPSDGVAVWLGDSNGQMSVSPPAVNSGKRLLRLGIWDDGGLLWQIRDFGNA